MRKPVPRSHVILALCFLAASTQSIATTSPPSPSPLCSDTLNNIRNDGSFDASGCSPQSKPNIIIILADDLGWNDVSFHGSNQIPTPNIDALAYNGIILNQHYVPALCTPSRAALLTGKLPIHMGMQHSVIDVSEPRGLPLKEKLLPQYLKEAGYKTHAIGKWHLGYYKKEYTPTYRGFDSHFGYWNPLKDYYNHMVRETAPELFQFYGFDMRRNMSVAWDTKGKYTTDLFTEEAVRLIGEHDRDQPMFMYLAHLAVHSGNVERLLQAPEEEVAKFSYINDPERRIYAAMVSKLDESVGKVVTALKNRGMLENSVILFMTDNGAPSSGFLANHGSNYPLRGMKNCSWEGGTRGVAVIWSPLIENSRRVSNQMIYMTDWLPTLLSIAGLEKTQQLDIDGKNIWSSLNSEESNPRNEILVNIDDIANYSAIRSGDFKYVNGMTDSGSKWEGASGRPNDEAKEGTSPSYDPEKVLHSEVGLAISELVTIRQIKKNEERVNSSKKNGMTFAVEKEILTIAQIVQLRNNATVKCNVKEEDKIPCDPLKAPCLFDIAHDPCEMVNLADARPAIVITIEAALFDYQMTMLPAANVERDLRANPALWNNTWTNWDDPRFIAFAQINDQSNTEYTGTTITIMSVMFGILLVIVIAIFGVKCHRRIVSQRKASANITFDTTNSCASTQGIFKPLN